MSNPHLATPLMRWGPPSASVAVLGVHGRTQSPAFIREQADRIGLADAAWYAPTAEANSWYPNRFMEPVESNEPHLGFGLAAVASALDSIRADGFDDRSIVLFGFSQGACLLAEYLVRSPGLFAATILMTGGYIGPLDERDLDGNFERMPVLLDIAENDPWVPLARARQTALALASMGADVDFESHAGDEHVITDASIRRISKLLDRVTNGAPS